MDKFVFVIDYIDGFIDLIRWFNVWTSWTVTKFDRKRNAFTTKSNNPYAEVRGNADHYSDMIDR